MISIVIPCYNREELVVQTLLSIKVQTYKEWECIIVDDDSDDNTFSTIKEFIQEDDRFRLYRRPKSKPKGPSSCRNFAISKIKGEYLQFFDSDDVMHPEHLELKFNVINTNDFQFVSCDLKRTGFDIKLDFEFYEIEATNISLDIFTEFIKGDFSLMMMSPLWRFNFIKDFLPIREDMNMLEDHELYARALKNVTNYFHINRVLILIRDGHESLTNNFFKNVELGVNSYLKAIQTVNSLIDDDEHLRLMLIKKVLWVFRLAIAQKKYHSADLCLNFIKKIPKGTMLYIKILRIELFYNLFRVLGHGDTLGKKFLKI